MPCYNCGAVDSFQQEGGEHMEHIITFLISVMAGVISYLHLQMAEQRQIDSTAEKV